MKLYLLRSAFFFLKICFYLRFQAFISSVSSHTRSLSFLNLKQSQTHRKITNTAQRTFFFFLTDLRVSCHNLPNTSMYNSYEQGSPPRYYNTTIKIRKLILVHSHPLIQTNSSFTSGPNDIIAKGSSIESHYFGSQVSSVSFNMEHIFNPLTLMTLFRL